MANIGSQQPSPNADLIALLERHLAAAKAGQTAGVAIVSVTSGGVVNTQTCGPPAPLMIGAVQIQRQLLDTIFPPHVQHLAPSAGRLSS